MPHIVTQDQPEPFDESPAVANAIRVVIAAVGPAPAASVVYNVLGEMCPDLSGVEIGAVLRYFDGTDR